MSELPTGTVTFIHRRRGAVRTGEFGSNIPASAVKTLRGGCSGLRGPSVPWKTRPWCAMCWTRSRWLDKTPAAPDYFPGGAGSCTGC
jgi:hypothetical protein